MVAPTTFFWFGAAGMGLVTVVFVYAFLTDPRSRIYHLLLTGITGIAFVAYVLMAFGVGNVTGSNGSTVYVVRYLDWMATTPLIITYLGLLAGVDRRILLATGVLDLAMIGLALAANFVEGAAKYGLFVVASVLYVVLVYYLVRGIMSAVARRPRPVVTLFEKLRNITVVTWSIYPVVWILGPAAIAVLDETTKVLLFSYLDLLSKALFGLIVFNSQQSLAELPRLDALRWQPGTGE